MDNKAYNPYAPQGQLATPVQPGELNYPPVNVASQAPTPQVIYVAQPSQHSDAHRMEQEHLRLEHATLQQRQMNLQEQETRAAAAQDEADACCCCALCAGLLVCCNDY
mmetsp:Transcript_15348/g.27000  ORF Transcript_15348/g.27000 Transcript_15348/m.27000 type:complete len:108 (+) Transcript_15348:27-350(+)